VRLPMTTDTADFMGFDADYQKSPPSDLASP
jgi:hypothetical protein